MQESRAQRDISVSKQRPTPSRSVGCAISDAVDAHRFPTDWRLTVRRVGDPHKLQIKLTNNGVMMQNFNTDDMAHKSPRCIEWVASIHALQPGDILATGTNHRGLNPFMDGDKIELTCEGCGTLHITVRDDLQRTWSRITRLQHKQSGAEGVHTKQTSGKYAPTK